MTEKQEDRIVELLQQILHAIKCAARGPKR